MKSDLGDIIRSIRFEVWSQVTKYGSDMSWRSWWNTRWYTKDGFEIDGCRPQTIRGVAVVEAPYDRSLFGPSGLGRFGLAGKNVAYFGLVFVTATCETMKIFRDNPSLSGEEILRYISGETPSGENSLGYPSDHVLDKSAKLVDLRQPGNALFAAIAEQGSWDSADTFAESVAYTRDPSISPQTQVIAAEAFRLGYDGIWYTSVRTPPGVVVGSGECLVLFEGREHLIRPFGS